MGRLQDVITWVDEVYSLDTTDRVLGGALPLGVSNQAAQDLANRTAYLKSELEKLQDEFATLHPIGEVQMLAAPAYNAADYDIQGLGKVGTPAEHWALCNGVGGVADLRGRFVVGMDPDSNDYAQPGEAGGNDSLTLKSSNLPKTDLAITAKITDGNPNQGAGAADFTASTTTSNQARGKTITGSVGTNSPDALDIRPKYYVLVYRQRISN